MYVYEYIYIYIYIYVCARLAEPAGPPTQIHKCNKHTLATHEHKHTKQTNAAHYEQLFKQAPNTQYYVYTNTTQLIHNQLVT